MTEHHIEDIVDSIKPRSASNALLWTILAFFVLALAWAIFTKLDRTVHGQGRVVPTAQLQIVSNLEGGIVRQILVRSGSLVKAGAPMVLLDKTATGAELNTQQVTTEALRVKVSRLEAEIAGRQPVFPVSQNAALNEQIGIERSLYLSRQADLASLTAAGTARALQAQRAVSEAESNLAATSASRDAARQNVEALRPLVASGIEPKMSLVQAERQLSVSSAQVAAATSTIARTRGAVAESQALLRQAQQDWRSKAGDELATTQAELTSRSQSLPALEDRVGRTTVRAPLTGRVNRLFVTTVGGTIRAGEPIAEVVPLDKGLTIEVAVQPQDIAFIRMGQRALIKISAYDYSIYGGLEGQVIGISPDSIVNEKQGTAQYMVRVRTAQPGLRSASGQLLPIGPGMMADVNLIGDKRSVLSYLFSPITQLSQNAFRER